MDDPGSLRHAAVIEYVDAPVAWFYQRLGFDNCTILEIPDQTYMARLTGGAMSDVTIRKYANEMGSAIEIISVPEPRRPACPSWSHVAVSVIDCESLLGELVTKGASVVGGPVRSPSGPYLVAYVRDPSGNLVELVERLKE